MKSYNQLQQQFEKDVKQLREKCSHKKTFWAEHHWALGHSSGYKVRICERCNKILEEKPTREEREKAKEEWLKKQNNSIK